MRVFVDTKFGATFTFDLDRYKKVFDIKKGIEESQGIPVSSQKLFFKGVELFLDHYKITSYHIVNNSRLLLELRDDHVNTQMLHQSPYAIQGFVPSMASSNYGQVLPPSHASTMARSNQVPVPCHASNAFFNQDLRMMPRSNQVPLSHASEAFYNQDQHVRNDVGQVIHQPQESILETFSMDEFRQRVPEPWTAQDTLKMQGIWPSGTTGDNFNIQESSGSANKNQDLFQSEKSPLPQKLRVIMTQYDKPGRDFVVEVNASDNVEELRKQLENIQQNYQLDLPAEGYFFMNKEGVLDDAKSFNMNRVANGDTIEIIPKPAIEDFYPYGMDPTFGL
ncbi:hypothetical protein N665_1436s0011 [Sinapis alba]|nr:hypothetical protein N665_1436s0011 [Sinapis alba]